MIAHSLCYFHIMFNISFPSQNTESIYFSINSLVSIMLSITSFSSFAFSIFFACISSSIKFLESMNFYLFILPNLYFSKFCIFLVSRSSIDFSIGLTFIFSALFESSRPYFSFIASNTCSSRLPALEFLCFTLLHLHILQVKYV